MHINSHLESRRVTSISTESNAYDVLVFVAVLATAEDVVVTAAFIALAFISHPSLILLASPELLLLNYGGSLFDSYGAVIIVIAVNDNNASC